jgi:hypothetical protein
MELEFDPNVVLSLSTSPHMDEEENIFLGEASYRFIRIPVNQKVFYDSHVKERAAAELLNSEHSHSHGQKIHGVRKYKIFSQI